MNTDEIYNLLAKKLAGEASKEEIIALDEWIQRSPENRSLYNKLLTFWNNENKVITSKESQAAYNRFIEKLNTDHNKLYSYETYKSGTNWPLKYLYRVAAVILLAITISLIVFQKNAPQPEKATIATIDKVRPPEFEEVVVASSKVVKEEILEKHNPRGRKSIIKFQDGSIVYLNSDSKLKYPTSFDEKSREIYLEGEAFFDIAKDAKRPFIIHLQSGDIKVLGTSFNVKAYVGEENVETAVVTGKVAFIPRQKAKELSKITYIQPDQKAVFNNKTFQLRTQEVDGQLYKDWINGKIIFDNAPFTEVALALERWFGVPVKLENEQLINCHLTATFQQQSLKEILKLISLTGEYSYELNDSGLTIIGKGCSEKENE